MDSTKYPQHYKSSCGKWVLGSYIFYSNRSSMVINLRGLDKNENKHTGGWTNVGGNIRINYEQTRTDGRTDRQERYKELYI